MPKQDYIDHVLQSLPKWFTKSEREYETIKAFAEMFARVDEQDSFYHEMTFILNADEGPPDWLNQHAVDRRLLRQGGESNDSLRDRIRSLADAVNIATVTSTVQSIVDNQGIVGTVYILELRQNRGFFQVNATQSGTGGEFVALTGDSFAFVPDVTHENPLTTNGAIANNLIKVSGAATAANDGDYVITGAYLNGVTFDNASGVSETDPTVSWTLTRTNTDGFEVQGFADCFFDRGYRMSQDRSAFLVILPFGCDQTTIDTVADLLTSVKGAGVFLLIECRLT